MTQKALCGALLVRISFWARFGQCHAVTPPGLVIPLTENTAEAGLWQCCRAQGAGATGSRCRLSFGWRTVNPSLDKPKHSSNKVTLFTNFIVEPFQCLQGVCDSLGCKDN